MPKLPSATDFGKTTSVLSRRLDIASYDVSGIGRAGMHKANALKSLGSGVGQLGDGLGSYSKKIDAEMKKTAKKSSGGGGGGSGTGGSGSIDRSPVSDTGTGQVIESDIGISDAYTSSEMFQSDSTTAGGTAFQNATPEELKGEDWVPNHMAALRKAGRGVYGPIVNSPFVRDKDVLNIKRGMLSNYLKIERDLTAKRADALSRLSEGQHSENSAALYAPQYADPTADATDVWEREKTAILADRYMGAEKKDSSLQAAGEAAVEGDLSKVPYDKQIEQLSLDIGKRGKEPKFYGEIGEEGRKKVLENVINARKEQTASDKTSGTNLRDSVLRGDLPTAEQQEEWDARVAKNPHPDVLALDSEVKAAAIAREEMSGKSSSDRTIYIAQLKKKYGTETGKATEEQLKLVTALEEAHEAERKSLKDNALVHAAGKGIVTLMPLDAKDDDTLTATLEERGKQAQVAEDEYGEDPVFLVDKSEADIFLKRYMNGDPKVFQVINDGLGPRALDFIKSLSKYDKSVNPGLMLSTGRLAALSENNQAAEDTMAYLKLKKTEGYKPSLTNNKNDLTKITSRRRITQEVFGSSFRAASTVLERTRSHADMVAEVRMANGEEWEDDWYAAIVQEVAGQTTDENGIKWGGVAEGEMDPSGWWNQSPYKFVAPPNVQHAVAEKVLKSVRPSEFPSGNPIGVNGNPMQHHHFKTSKLVSTGDGEYAMVENVNDEGRDITYYRDPQTKDVYILRWADIQKIAKKRNSGQVR